MIPIPLYHNHNKQKVISEYSERQTGPSVASKNGCLSAFQVFHFYLLKKFNSEDQRMDVLRNYEASSPTAHTYASKAQTQKAFVSHFVYLCSVCFMNEHRVLDMKV